MASLQSKGNSKESIKPPSIKDISLYPEIIDKFNRKRLKYKLFCLRQDSIFFIHWYLVNSYIAYKLGAWSKDFNIHFTLSNSLFRIIKLTKNDDLNK